MPSNTDCQLLLLATGQVAAAAPEHAVENRKKRKHVIGHVACAARKGRKAGLEIFLDRQVGKDASAFRHVTDAQRGDAVGRPVGGGMAEDSHRALARMREPHQAA